MSVEIIGFIASLFVFASFVPKDVRWIRLINIVGCVVWVVYGILKNSPSVWVMNALVMVLHLYHLIKTRKVDNSNIK